MLTYPLEQRGELPLYEYLYRCIQKDIMNGVLKCNEKLPSKRSFAKHMNISVVTVENAYGQLLIEGYIYSREKSGFFVSDIRQMRLPKFSPSFLIPDTKDSVTDVTALSDQTIPEFAEPSVALTDIPEYFADFKTNSIPEDSFPFSIWSRLSREVLSEKSPNLLKAQPGNGAPALCLAISEYLHRFRGMTVRPEQVFIGAGTEYLYSLIVQLLGRDLVYALEDPGYHKAADIIASNGAACEYIPLDASGLSCKALQKSPASVVHISPAHHFPTGIIMPIKRRQELLSWAYEKENRYIIEDDYDSEFRFQGRPIMPLQGIDTKGRVIYMNTFSKSLTPSIRISYMVLPMSLVKRFTKRLSFYSCTVSGFEQYTLASFISRGYYEQHINRMRNAYKEKRDQTIQALRDSRMAPLCKIKEENSGLHFLLEVKTQLSDAELIQAAKDNGIRINCLSNYYHNTEIATKHTLVLNYSGVDNKKIPEAISRLSGIL